MGAVLLVFGAVALAESVVVVALRRWRPRASEGKLSRRVAGGLVLVVTPLVVLTAYARLAPLPSPYALVEQPGFVVLDAEGVVLQRDTSAGLRVPVALADVAPVMVEATIAAEDKRFRSHPGVDPLAAARALLRLPFQRSGASTLTQQVARRLYLRDGAGGLLERKAREALTALQLEAHYSKDEILALYLNEVYYGRGAYGVEAAARVYFGVSARNLDLAQAAFLAGLPQLPADYGAAPDAPAVRERQRYVLDRLVESARVSPLDAAAAKAEALQMLPELAPVVAPHFVEYALAELAAIRPDLAGRQGLVIETTLDAGLQAEAERLVRFHLERLAEKSVGNAAVVVLEPASGRVLAMVGSAGFDAAEGGQINMAVTPRQPGSALKPFLYAAALERGYTAASTVLDLPTTFETASGPYAPLDYDRRFHGPVSLRVALASSLNVPAVRTLNEVGIEAFLDVAHRFGLRTLTDSEVYGLALTLGGGEVRLLDLTGAYGALATGGQLAQPYAVERVRDAAGRVLYERPPRPPARVVAEERAYILADILADPLARQLGFGEAPALTLSYRAGVKTGTTTEFRDNWTVGFTPERVVGVWVGNTDNRPMKNVSGVTGAAPIWRAVMDAAMAGVTPTWPRPPAGLRRGTVCYPTGLQPGPYCPTRVDEWFVAGTEPSETEDYYRRDASGRLLIDPPVEARAWAIEAGLTLVNDRPSAGSQPFVVQPAQGSVLFLAPELPSQALILRASPPAGAQRIEFRVDGALVGVASAADPTAVWPVSAGAHVLEVSAVLGSGEVVTASARFEVRP